MSIANVHLTDVTNVRNVWYCLNKPILIICNYNSKAKSQQWWLPYSIYTDSLMICILDNTLLFSKIREYVK